MNETIYNFQVEVFRQLDAAFSKYRITSVLPEDVLVYCDVKGGCAGKAGWKRGHDGREYYLKFNEEAIHKYYDEQVNSTIPHEIAHLIAYMRPDLGAKGHNNNWRRIAISLGDVNAAERTHSMQLTVRRKVKTRFVYNVNGNDVMLGPGRHKKLQQGVMTYSHRQYGKISKDMFVGKKTIHPANQTIAKPAPKVPKSSSTIGGPSKVEQAMAIYKALTFRGEGRGQIIEAFMSELNMSKAGASTYYYNTKNKMS
jgi:predicted SprT family Zn-dependent metalloprotease